MNISFPFADTEVSTFSSVGLTPFASMVGNGLVMSIAHMRKILPAKFIELHAQDENTVMVIAKTDRVDYNFTIRDCKVHTPGKTIKLPFDIFVRTVIMSSGANVEWSVSEDGESKFIAFFNNGMMSRKCTFAK